jgi:micrococcal nuclease
MLSLTADKTKLITYVMLFLVLNHISGISNLPAYSAKAEKVYPGTYEVIVIRIHDGDTMTVEIPALPSIIGQHINIRLDGIDTPEITDKRIEIKSKALAARQFVKERVDSAKKVEITHLKRDKYFRIDARILLDGKDLGQMLLQEGLAKPYDGGTKSPW